MFTRNYDNLMFRLMGYYNSTAPTQTTFEDGTNCGYRTFGGTYKANNGTSISVSANSGILRLTTERQTLGYQCAMILGTGTSAESYNDYTITTNNTLTMNSFSASQTIDSSGNLVITNSKIATNNTASDITISEIGIVYYGTISGSSNDSYLLYRKKLDTPVVVSANGGVQSFEVKFMIPRANMPS